MCPVPPPQTTAAELRAAHTTLLTAVAGDLGDTGHKIGNVRNKTEFKPLAQSSTMRRKTKPNQKQTPKAQRKESGGVPRLFWQGSCCSIPHSVLWDGNQTIKGPHSSWAYTKESRELLHRSPWSGVNLEWWKNQGPGSLATADVQRVVRKQLGEMPCGSFEGCSIPSLILPGLPTALCSPQGQAERLWELPDQRGITGGVSSALQKTRLGYDHVWFCKKPSAVLKAERTRAHVFRVLISQAARGL